MPDNDNRKKKIRLLIVIIIILGRYITAVITDDSTMQIVCATIMGSSLTTLGVYSTPEDEWSIAQADVHTAAVAFFEANELGDAADCTDLGTLVSAWDLAIKGLG